MSHANADGHITVPMFIARNGNIVGTNICNDYGTNCHGGEVNDTGTPQPTQVQQDQLAIQQMSLSSKGLDFIKQHEGYSDKVYKDSAGNSTIGYGHLIKNGENFDKGITEKAATALLSQDANTAVNAVNGNLKANVSQTKFDSLVDFTYNLGAGNLAKSTLLSNINAGKDVTKENFTDWNHAWRHSRSRVNDPAN